MDRSRCKYSNLQPHGLSMQLKSHKPLPAFVLATEFGGYTALAKEKKKEILIQNFYMLISADSFSTAQYSYNNML